MKRILIVAILAVLCIAAVGYRPVHEAWARRQYRDEAVKNEIPLVLDAKTQAVLSGADRVETFRLVDFHEEERYTDTERNLLSSPHTQSLDDHQVLRVSPAQGEAFADALRAALAKTPGPIGKDGLMSGVPSCFDPGVGFRVWNGKSSVDLCVCFYCTAIEIDTNNAANKSKQTLMTPLGSSRPEWLALSKQAFPQDAALARLN